MVRLNGVDLVMEKQIGAAWPHCQWKTPIYLSMYYVATCIPNHI